VADERRELSALNALRGVAGEGVANPPADRARELCGGVDPARELQGERGSWPADRLVPNQTRRQVVTVGDLVGEHDVVFERLGGALPKPGRSCVGSVAQTVRVGFGAASLLSAFAVSPGMLIRQAARDDPDAPGDTRSR
jgi:hypothetical protein